MNSPNSRHNRPRQPRLMCRSRLMALYCVSTSIFPSGPPAGAWQLAIHPLAGPGLEKQQCPPPVAVVAAAALMVVQHLLHGGGSKITPAKRSRIEEHLARVIFELAAKPMRQWHT